MEFFEKIRNRFPFLTEEKLGEILAMSQLVVLEKGDVFIESGTRARKVALVLNGLMRNYIINDSGEQVTVVFSTELQGIAPFATIFLNEPATETTEAVESSALLVFNYDEFRARAEVDIDILRVYTDMVQWTLVFAIKRIEDFTQKSPEQRYLRLLEQHGDLVNRAPLKHLASYLGITTFSLSRIRKRVAKNRN